MTGRRAESAVQERIVRAARKLFVEKGFVDTRTREIARAAETSESGILRFFENKEELLKAAHNDVWADINRYISSQLAHLGRRDDPRDEVIEIARAFWTYYQDHPKTGAFLVANVSGYLLDQEEEFYFQRIEKLCEKAEAQGLLGQFRARAVAEGLFGILEGVILGWHFVDHVEQAQYPHKITLDEATGLVRKLLY